jgi:CheY-like chemotaxis protein
MEKKKILVIEDNELNMKLIRAILLIGEFKILEADSAETGLVLAQQKHPDLILMDIQLPGMDGLTATRKIKKDSILKDIPILALSGYAMKEDIDEATKAGCAGYITKPIDTRNFLDMLNQHLH